MCMRCVCVCGMIIYSCVISDVRNDLCDEFCVIEMYEMGCIFEMICVINTK